MFLRAWRASCSIAGAEVLTVLLSRPMARLRRFKFIAALTRIGNAMLVVHMTHRGIGDNFLASRHLLPPPFAVIIAIESPN